MSFLRRFSTSFRRFRHHHRSPLVVLGDEGDAKKNTVIPDMSPEDVRRRIDDQQLVKNVSLRKLGDKIDIEALKANYADWVKAESDFKALDDRIEKAREKIKDHEEISGMKKAEYEEVIRNSRKERKSLANERIRLEEEVVLPFLDLPNRLHSDCPEHEDKIMFEHFEQGNSKLPQISAEDVSEAFFDGLQFLTGRAAKLELELCEKAENHLKEEELEMISAPDFSRSVVVAGCGIDPEDGKTTLALNPRHDFSHRDMHLVGGASLPALVAFYSKQVPQRASWLPERRFCIGRQYETLSGSGMPTQSTAVQLIGVAENETQQEEIFIEFFKLFQTFYGVELQTTFRLVNRSADKLGTAEMLRVAVEMAERKDAESFIEVGYLSIYGNYLSRRLMLKTIDEETAQNPDRLKDLFIVGGTFLDVTKVIQSLI